MPLCERVYLFGEMEGSHAAGKLDETRQRISDFERGAYQHGFTFRGLKGKGARPA